MKGYVHDNGFFVFADGLVAANEVIEIMMVHDKAIVVRRDKVLVSCFRPLLPKQEERYRPMLNDTASTVPSEPSIAPVVAFNYIRPDEEHPTLEWNRRMRETMDKIMAAIREYNRIAADKPLATPKGNP